MSLGERSALGQSVLYRPQAPSLVPVKQAGVPLRAENVSKRARKAAGVKGRKASKRFYAQFKA